MPLCRKTLVGNVDIVQLRPTRFIGPDKVCTTCMFVYAYTSDVEDGKGRVEKDFFLGRWEKMKFHSLLLVL